MLTKLFFRLQSLIAELELRQVNATHLAFLVAAGHLHPESTLLSFFQATLSSWPLLRPLTHSCHNINTVLHLTYSILFLAT